MTLVSMSSFCSNSAEQVFFKKSMTSDTSSLTGKSSLALGVLYAEGSRRYLDALSTYTRRRMTQAARAGVD